MSDKMTCREWMQANKPFYTSRKYRGGAKGCPSDYGLVKDEAMFCDETCPNDEKCTDCWNQPIERDPNEATADNVEAVDDDVKPTIADSGNRREFESGAVRDMGAGADKGRCDLMPLDVVGKIIKADALNYVALYQKKKDINHLYEALYAFSNEAYSESDTTMLLEVAKHFEAGALKYGENNWQKGIPTWCYIDSAVRHYLKWLRGDADEPHDRAFVWNIMCCIWTVEHNAACGGESVGNEISV